MLSLGIRRLSNFTSKCLIVSTKSVRPLSINCSSTLHDNNLISYKLPEKATVYTGIVGDKNVEKLPILDFKKTNFALLDSINSSVSIPQPNIFDEIDVNTFNILSVLINENNLNISYELPPLPNCTNEKRADYYKHKDPNRFTHLLWVRHRKMKKHQRNKWRKKNLAMIKRKRLVRNISKEKLFRAELLAQIQEAENFNPKVYIENILHTIDNVPKTETRQEKYQRYLDLIRKNRTQTNLTMPKFED